MWGCNCRKTRCLKRYCECFIRQKKCTVTCNCEDCENGKDEDIINEMYAQPTPQKKRRMPIEV